MTTPQSLYIIDGSSFIYRAYHAVRNLSTSTGLPTNAVYGTTQMLMKIMQEKPDYLVIAFDAKGPTFRHTLYPEYKAHRPPMPEDLAVQIPYIHRIVAALGIPKIVQKGVEADDIIGTLALKGESAGLSVTIVSGDKDLFQLISPNIRVYDTLKGKIFTADDIRTRFGVVPSQLVEIMGLMGDAVDNIPGVCGIGEKTAIALIGQFGTIEALLSNLDAVEKKSVRAALRTEQDVARLSRNLATLRCDCPIPFELDQLIVSPPDPALFPLLEELEFTSLLKEMRRDIPFEEANEESAPQASQIVPYPKVDLSVCTERIAAVGEEGGCVSLIILTGPDAKRLGLGFVINGDGFCLAHDASALIPPLKAVLESDRFLKIGHNLKPLLTLLCEQGVMLSPPFFDTQIAAHLLDPTRGEYTLSAITERYLHAVISDNQEEAALSALLQLQKPLVALLQEKALFHLFSDIELPLLAVLSEMEQAGVKMDLTRIAEISAALHQSLLQTTERIYAIAGGPFNINSPKQLGHILFDVLGLHPPKKTKAGYSTDEEVLTQLAAAHELPEAILAYRQEMKLKSTYVEVLLQKARQGRIHTTFHQTVTATGRLSSSDPNLQNIPIRGEWGGRLRETFIVEEGHLLLAADYNQIELRILAHCSGDSALVDAFRRGDDIHLQTAMEIFGLPKEQITSDMRRVGKTVNFGIIYGISPFGLASQLGIVQSEAKRYIDLYFSRYPGVRQFIEETLVGARQTGGVTTLLGRRRPIPEISGRNKKMQEAAERLAINTRIQGSAADIIKVAMREIFRWMRAENLRSRMILQVHDELLFEVPEAEGSLLREGVASRMEQAAVLSVPLTVEIGVGKNWRAAKG